ncbi:MAG TPA: hypothetical protein VGV92_05090 [Gammaproteobacteria bacterium]|nr:hypothetical protein [Gammaproteobacteria bacterium]
MSSESKDKDDISGLGKYGVIQLARLLLYLPARPVSFNKPEVTPTPSATPRTVEVTPTPYQSPRTPRK